MIKTVYITGCLGLIGSHLTIKCLDQEGWYVIGVDKMTYAANSTLLNGGYLNHPRFKFINSDINDLTSLYECDYIINTAAETHVGNSIINSSEFVKSNIDGVHNLLELIRLYKSETSIKPVLIQFSTDEVYGDIVEGAHTESHLLKPSNPYSATKAAADMLITAWGRTHDIPYMIIRPTNNYGIGQYVEKLIPKSIKCLNLGRAIPLHNHGLPKRSWLHASDTAKAVMTLIDKGTIGEIYNVGGTEYSNIEVVNHITDIYYTNDYTKITPELLDFSYSRVGQDVRYALDDSKIKALNWKPEKLLFDELVPIVEYYKRTHIW